MVYVVTNTGKPLMPTTEYRARKLFKKGRAKIYKYRPFTIMIIDRENGDTQPIEYKSDVGYQHVGISVASDKHEYTSIQVDLLPDETEKHNDQRKYRRTRRNRKRYRKPRFDNRKKQDGWLAPSIRHKVDTQLDFFRRILAVCPITDAYLEMGKFDTQLLKALAEGKEAPQGKDYQQGERYGIETLRQAVFERDHHTCVFCGRSSMKDNAKLHVHHIGYWKQDRSDRLNNLATACEKCHTPANHKPGGLLYGKEPKVGGMADATYMTMIRWQLLERFKQAAPAVSVHITYGAKTKLSRQALGLAKSHANDAYSIGERHPKHRTPTILLKKIRRNDRILQKFYDAVYIDSRDGTRKTGQQLSNGRINRNHNKDSENLHPYRQKKVKKGYRTIRRQRTTLKPGSKVFYRGEILTVHGTHSTQYISKKTGKTTIRTYVEFTHPTQNGKKSTNLNNLTVLQLKYNTGWKKSLLEKEAV